MDHAFSIFNNGLFKGSDNERIVIYNKVFSGGSLTAACVIGYIPPNSADWIDLEVSRDKRSSNHTEYNNVE
jgi:hypothetical protein